MVSRPKSSATVVVVLSVVRPRRSMSAAAVVIAASVESTGTSEIADTAVVFPTPKPPATTILTGSGVGAAGTADPPAYGSADGL